MAPRQKTAIRLGALVALLVGLYLVGHVTGVTRDLSVERVKAHVEEAGALGFLLFLVVFSLGELVHVPGLVFVAAGILVYGRLWGGMAGFVGALCSLCVSFIIVRTVGGQPLNELKTGRMRRLLDRLEARPVRTVFVLRMLLWMAPPLNYALAMSGVSFRHYVVGSALGLVLPIAGAAVLFDWLISYLQ